MVRTAVLVLMTVAAISAGVLGGLSFATPLYIGLPVSSRLLGYVYMSEGLARFYVFQSDQDVHLSPSPSRHAMAIVGERDDRVGQAFRHSFPNQIDHYEVYWQRSNKVLSPALDPTLPTIRMSGVRFQILIVVAMMIAYPVITVIAGRRMQRRRRIRASRGLCETCGYDLTGNTTGVCSECGEAI